MPEATYVLCALTSGGCAWLTYRGYRTSRSRLLLWSTLCFVGLALNNLLLLIDLAVVRASVDLSVARSLTALVALIVLLVGLVQESDARSR